MPRKIISNAQQVCRDTFASAPSIDLVLRANGEDKVSIIDPLGNVFPAGFDAPTIAPLVAAGSTSGLDWTVGTTFTGTVYWQYRYVYVAKTRYTLVQNAVTGGGSPAPRSNPSPSVGGATPVPINNSSNADKSRVVTVVPSQRNDISHIWIYRTNVWDTADKANTASAGGLMFWIGEVVNNPNALTISYEDKAVVGDEQIENDCFPAPTFKLPVFDGIYFWGIGNDDRTLEITLDISGLVINNTGSPWFNGRDGQQVNFVGITSGGFDNHGTFYIKILSPTLAQLYSDLALTNSVGISFSGITEITFRGLAETLFRSKPSNPFAWGFTDLIGEIQVPTPYNFSLGGGNAKSLAISPELNLLKIDLESPGRAFTLNLKNAGTPNFEPSLRPIADSYTSSINAAQFAATVSQGRNQLWALDTKTFAIIQSDGTSQFPVSDYVTRTMRRLSVDGADREMFHGGYLPRLELNLMFVRTEGAEGSINRAIFNHWPTGYWGVLDTFDVLASKLMFDPYENVSKLIVGNSHGWIGEFGAKDQYQQWVPNGTATLMTTDAINFPNEYLVFLTDPNTGYTISDLTIIPGVVGNWIFIWDKVTSTNKYVNFRFAIINAVQAVAIEYDHIGHPGITVPGFKFTLDGAWYNRNYEIIDPGSYIFSFPYAHGPTYFSIGVIEMQAGKFFNASLPFMSKNIEEVLFTFSYPNIEALLGGVIPLLPSVVISSNYDWNLDTPAILDYPPMESQLTYKQLDNPKTLSFPNIFGKVVNLPVDQTAVFGIMVSDRNTFATTIQNYQINVSPT